MDINNQLTVTTDKKFILQHCLDIQELLKQTDWAKNRDLHTIKMSIENSSVCCAVIDCKKNKIVAFARSISDYATMYYLSDVVVDQYYRKLDLGKRVVKEIIEVNEKIKGKYGILITKDAQGLYAQFGFEEYAYHCMCKFNL